MKTIEEMNTGKQEPAIMYSYYKGYARKIVRESEYEFNARIVAEYFGLTKRSVLLCRGVLPEWNDGLKHEQYIVYITRNGKTMEVRFTMSAVSYEIAEEVGKEIHPSWYDLLACITKYDPGTFEDFCASYGYDEDSRKAEKIYFDVVKEYRDFARLFPEGIPEEIMGIS